MPNQSELEIIQVPVNLNGSLSVRVPKNMHRAEVERLAIERFSATIAKPFHIGENAESHARFEGEAWGEVGCFSIPPMPRSSMISSCVFISWRRNLGREPSACDRAMSSNSRVEVQ